MADVANSHPELVKRYNNLVKLCWSNSWYVGITSSSRSYDEQMSLYQSYKAGTGNNAANPDSVLGPSPWGWTVHGSYHMVQRDGYTHALDLHWQQCTAAQLAEAAKSVGLRLTVPGENWHFQWWNGTEIFPVLEEEPKKVDDDMAVIIHDPILRDVPGGTIWDFTYLPADTGGQAFFGFVVSSQLFVRRRGGAPVGFTVYIQGIPTKYEVPEDGTTIKVPVTHEGLISVVGDVIVEAREEKWRA